MNLSPRDFELILESLEYTKKAYTECKTHPNYEFKRSQIQEVEELILKVRELRNS